MDPIRHLRFSIIILVAVMGFGTLGEQPAILDIEKTASGVLCNA